jgi:polyisoprenyl-teichoic acid--peptidoglycan teichoic acid transferase
MRKKDKNKDSIDKKDKVKNKKKGIVFKIISILQIVCSIVLFGFVFIIDVLPMKYLLLLLLILAILDIIFFLIIFKSRLKKGIKKFFSVISVLLSILFLVGSFYLYKTYGVISGMIDTEYETYNYSVMVLKDSDYNSVSDIKNEVISYYETKSNENKLLVEKVNKLGKESKSYTNLNTLATDLLNKETNVIVLEDNYKKTLIDEQDDNEYNEVKDFNDKTKTIYTFSIKVKKDNTSKDVDVVSEVFNIYISGIDTYGTVSSVSRSDVNIVVTVNPNTRQVLLTSIPRDYYVQLHDTTGYKDKLTHAGIYGTDCSIKTIEDLLDIDINYYFKVNFTSLIDIVDALGGVNVYADQSFSTWNGYHFTKGYNKVDGNAALAFVRERKTFTNGDRQRGINQQALISAMINKCISKEILTKYTSLLNSVKGSIITNMPTKTMLSLVKMQLKSNTSWNISTNSLDGTNASKYTYSYNYQQLYVMEPSEESVENGKELINKVLNGEVLESSYTDSDGTVHSVTKSNVSKKSSTSSKTTVKKEEIKKEEVKESIDTSDNTSDTKDDVVDDSSVDENNTDESLNDDTSLDNKDDTVDDSSVDTGSEDSSNVPSQEENAN